jgi:hypothetical protein
MYLFEFIASENKMSPCCTYTFGAFCRLVPVILGVCVAAQVKPCLEDGCLLGCCAVQSGTSLQTFQRCLLHRSDDGGSKQL